MATINLGNIRFNWLGEYNSSTTYTKDDVVRFDGSSFIARKTVKGINPTKNEYWDLMIAGAEKPYIVGEQKFTAFRVSELPAGWYCRNGDNYLLDSPQGRALNGLSASYKEDYKITIKLIEGKQYINVPSAFSPDGRGYFERAVNGITRQVGNVENDKIRNITGEISSYGIVGAAGEKTTGAIYRTKNTIALAGGGIGCSGFAFDASRAVPTGLENTVINEGKTPVIYLGV